MRSFSLESPAKINLFLKIIRKRPDGFHDLVTLFERISLSDTIHFTANSAGRIRIACDHPHVPLGPKNLIHRAAAKRLRDEVGRGQP